ncbi:MAG: TldD/PmbA family protein [Myxococcota bacterium]|nr:TldD/PmbA family protein [Myxococcota bacterium]
MNTELQDIAEKIKDLALELGADEATVTVSRSTSNQLSQRDGQLEECKQSQSQGVQVRLLVDNRYSVHSAAESRVSALRPFLKQAIDATRFLEEDSHRRLPKLEDMGSGNPNHLDAYDHSLNEMTPDSRRQALNELETLGLNAAKQVPLKSLTAHVWDSQSSSCRVSSNGYSAGWSRTSSGQGASISLFEESGRRPEAYDYYSARHSCDLPSAEAIAESLVMRGRRRIGTEAIKSECLPMLLENRCVSRILGVLISPLSGNAIYEQRSCMADKLDTPIGASSLQLFDDPLIPRALNSRPYDGDGFETHRRPIIENGILKTFLLGIYNARRLGQAHTTASTSNLVIPASEDSPESLLNQLPRAIRVEGFLGGNANAMTGDFSFGITGTLFEKGEAIQGISEMNVSGNIFDLCAQYLQPANDVWTYSAWRTPSLLFDNVQFSGL